MAQLTVRIDDDLKDHLQTLARREGKSTSDVVRGLVQRYVQDPDRGAALRSLWRRMQDNAESTPSYRFYVRMTSSDVSGMASRTGVFSLRNLITFNVVTLYVSRVALSLRGAGAFLYGDVVSCTSYHPAAQGTGQLAAKGTGHPTGHPAAQDGTAPSSTPNATPSSA